MLLPFVPVRPVDHEPRTTPTIKDPLPACTGPPSFFDLRWSGLFEREVDHEAESVVPPSLRLVGAIFRDTEGYRVSLRNISEPALKEPERLVFYLTFSRSIPFEFSI